MVQSEHYPATPPLSSPDLELFFDLTPSLCCVIDVSGQFRQLNSQFVKVLGYSTATLMAQSFLEFVHDDDRQSTLAAIAPLLGQIGLNPSGSKSPNQKSLDPRQTVTFKNRYRCADGGYRCLQWQARIKANLVYAAAADITDQRQVEEILRQERDFSQSILDTVNSLNERVYTEVTLHDSPSTLATIFDLAGEAIICIDQHQQIRMFNQTAEHVFGYRAREVIGRPLDILLPEQFRAVHRQHVRHFAKSPASSRRAGERSTRISGQRKNGEIFPAEASISKSHTKEGVWFTVMLQDITERVQAEAAIRRSEEQLRTTANALPVLIAYIDVNECYCFNNRAYEEWLGVPYQSLEGQPLEQALGPDIYYTIQPYLRQALNGESVTFEAEFPNSDRAYHWVSVSYQPDIHEGKVRGCFALTQDISDHKAADQLKNEFVSVVSHELRTPLTSIHGSLKLLTTGKLGQLESQGQELLEIALNNTERLTRLVNDVLDLERIESGRIKMVKVRCQVADVLQQAAQAMRSMAQTYGVIFKVVPTDATIYADPDHIEQTLTNLLSNAIKFSPRGKAVILKAVEQPHQVVFKVIDHGRGIPEDKLETIFERFQQVDASDTRKHGGTGLGLAICREIVQHHNGRIWVTSVHGEGSTFCFTLPKDTESAYG